MASRLYKTDISEEKDTLFIYVQHEPNDSYSRSVDPTATRAFKKAWFKYNLQGNWELVETKHGFAEGLSKYIYNKI